MILYIPLPMIETFLWLKGSTQILTSALSTQPYYKSIIEDSVIAIMPPSEYCYWLVWPKAAARLVLKDSSIMHIKNLSLSDGIRSRDNSCVISSENQWVGTAFMKNSGQSGISGSRGCGWSLEREKRFRTKTQGRTNLWSMLTSLTLTKLS